MRTAIIPVLLLAVMTGGCNWTRYFLYLIAPPPPTETIKAEFDKLPGHTIAVVIYVDEKVQWEYPYARLRVSSMITDQLRTRLKEENIKLIDPRLVVKFQHENIHWDEMDKTQFGKRFEADYLLYVTLVEYSSRERGMVHLYRGRITAEASIYDTSKVERASRVWKNDDFRIIYPPDDAIGRPGEDDLTIRYETERRFAEVLIRKFYDHKAPTSVKD